VNKKAAAFRIASVSLCFFLSLFAPAHVQAATSGAAIGAPSPLSAMAHDFATWLNHVAGRGANNHRAGRHPLPGQVASHPVTSNKEWSEFVSPAGSGNRTRARSYQ